MNRTALALCFAGLLAGCSSISTHSPGESRAEHETEEERAERNRAALRELMARQSERSDADSDTPPPRALPELPVEVVRPSSHALTEDGQLRRGGVLAFVDQGPHAVLGAAVLLPARDESGVIGFEVSEIHPSGRWIVEAGVQEGDVVRGVNGRSIVMPDEFMAVFESLSESDEIVVDLLRAGQELQLVFPIVDEVASSATR